MAAAGAEVWLLSRTDKGRVIRRMGGYGQRLYCMRYADPELAVGCADGSMRVYDLYSGRCSRLFRLQNFLLLHGQLPVTFKEQSEY
jgi:hypothetical protein